MILFENIYKNAYIIRLQEALKIRTEDDFFNAIRLQDTPSGRTRPIFRTGLVTKKSFQHWIANLVDGPDSEDRELLFTTLNKLLLKLPKNSKGDYLGGVLPTLCLIISKVPSLDDLIQLIEDAIDGLVALATAWDRKSLHASSSFKEITEGDYNINSWLKLSSLISETDKAKENIDFKELYTSHSGRWKLFMPFTFKGDTYLSLNIEDCGKDEEGHPLRKTHWCTAAQKYYWNQYTSDNKYFPYIIKEYDGEKCINAWQLAFYDEDKVELMDKMDHPHYNEMLLDIPQELVDAILDDDRNNHRMKSLFRDYYQELKRNGDLTMNFKDYSQEKECENILNKLSSLVGLSPIEIKSTCNTILRRFGVNVARDIYTMLKEEPQLVSYPFDEIILLSTVNTKLQNVHTMAFISNLLKRIDLLQERDVWEAARTIINYSKRENLDSIFNYILTNPREILNNPTERINALVNTDLSTTTKERITQLFDEALVGIHNFGKMDKKALEETLVEVCDKSNNERSIIGMLDAIDYTFEYLSDCEVPMSSILHFISSYTLFYGERPFLNRMEIDSIHHGNVLEALIARLRYLVDNKEKLNRVYNIVISDKTLDWDNFTKTAYLLSYFPYIDELYKDFLELLDYDKEHRHGRDIYFGNEANGIIYPNNDFIEYLNLWDSVNSLIETPYIATSFEDAEGLVSKIFKKAYSSEGITEDLIQL